MKIKSYSLKERRFREQVSYIPIQEGIYLLDLLGDFRTSTSPPAVAQGRHNKPPTSALSSLISRRITSRYQI